MRDLLLHFLMQVDLVFLAEIGEEDKDIGQFFFYVLAFFCGEIAGLLGRLPEEVFSSSSPASMERASARFISPLETKNASADSPHTASPSPIFLYRDIDKI